MGGKGLLKFKCKGCGREHFSSKEIPVICNGVTRFSQSVNGEKAVFESFAGDLYCDDYCFYEVKKNG